MIEADFMDLVTKQCDNVMKVARAWLDDIDTRYVCFTLIMILR